MSSEPQAMTSSLPHLVLSGFMGAGKSTTGRVLSVRTGVPFVDLDEAVVALASSKAASAAAPEAASERAAETASETAPEARAVGALFAELGEAAFRRLEAEALERALAAPAPSVIAAGGGALLDPANRERALDRARVVTLTAPPEALLERLRQPGEPRRPLLDGASAPGAADTTMRIRALLEERANVYAEAHATIATEGRTPEAVAAAVLRAWQAPCLVVRLGARSYPVRFAGDAAAGTLVADALRALRPSQWFLVTDTTVHALWGARFVEVVREGAGTSPAAVVQLEPGEREKRLGAVERILGALIDNGADRDAVVVALGGGVVSDVAGFAAAVLLRGVRWISVPTTLLSMADAAIGGKTGVDLGRAKNAVGAFHQPSAVIIDVRHAGTETDRAFTGGLAEIVKAGAIADPELVALLCGGVGAARRREPALIEQAVARAAAVKARIVALDEREAGPRALLNFGHTLGHALEAAGGFERWTHGEAVALGMVGALRAGRRLGLTEEAAEARVVELLERLGLPVRLERSAVEEALPLLSLDKKRRGGSVRAVFVTAIGRAVTESVPLDELARLYLDAAT